MKVIKIHGYHGNPENSAYIALNELKAEIISPYLDYASPLIGGTYFFEGQWERLDNILLSSFFFDWEGIEYEGTTIIKGGDASDYLGRPLKYDKSTGKGVSDHFALKSTFTI